MEINEFIEKVKERGYEAKRTPIDGYRDEIIISEDDYYHVSINPTAVFDATFEEIMNHVECEIQKLKDKIQKNQKLSFLN